MKKIIVLLIAAISFSGVFAAEPNLKSDFANDFPKIGSIDSPSCYSPIDAGKCFVRMFHNNGAVYIQCLIRDKSLQSKFIMQGVTLYVDILGKKGKKYGIVFPKAGRDAMLSATGGSRQQQSRQAISAPQIDLKPLIDQMAFVPAVLKANKNETVLAKTSASLDYIDGLVVYSVSMPVKSLGGKLGKKSEVAIGLSSEFKMSSGTGGDMPSGRGMSGNRPPDGMMGGGGRPGGSGMGGGMRPPMDGSREGMGGMTKQDDQWAIFSLK